MHLTLTGDTWHGSSYMVCYIGKQENVYGVSVFTDAFAFFLSMLE